ncbi:hypothetical protein KM043_007849 [Ampulex compressa]|nr:hypothetical protein KM043_007849 [Ampulex compressa]
MLPQLPIPNAPQLRDFRSKRTYWPDRSQADNAALAAKVLPPLTVDNDNRQPGSFEPSKVVFANRSAEKVEGFLGRLITTEERITDKRSHRRSSGASVLRPFKSSKDNAPSRPGSGGGGGEPRGETDCPLILIKTLTGRGVVQALYLDKTFRWFRGLRFAFVPFSFLSGG